MSGEGGYIQNNLNSCEVIDNTDPENPVVVSEIPEVVEGGVTITGQIVDNHMSRPGPVGVENGAFAFSNGTPFTGCRVAINKGISGKTIYSQKCDYQDVLDEDGNDPVPASFTVAPEPTKPVKTVKSSSGGGSINVIVLIILMSLFGLKLLSRKKCLIK